VLESHSVLEFRGRPLKKGKKLTSYGVEHCSEIVVKSRSNLVTRQQQHLQRRSMAAKAGAQDI
jgi:hypothetical protein